jgi:hypothetical protein
MSNLQIINDSTKAYVMGPSLYNTSFPGEILSSMVDVGLDECKQVCLDNNKCLYIGYNGDNRNCAMYGAMSDDSRITGIKSIDTYDIYPKASLRGVPLGDDLLSVPLSECENKCTSDVGCEAFSFGNGFCSLKKVQPKAGNVTSFKSIQKTSAITNPADQLTFNCCTGQAIGANETCGDKNPYTTQCDAAMTTLCQAYPYLPQCQCIRRDSNFQYQKVRSQLEKVTGGDLKDECWYPPCQDINQDYIPTTMIPATVQFYNGTGIVKINDLKCVNESTRCQFKDIYNPQINRAECNGINMIGNIMDNRANGTGNDIGNGSDNLTATPIVTSSSGLPVSSPITGSGSVVPEGFDMAAYPSWPDYYATQDPIQWQSDHWQDYVQDNDFETFDTSLYPLGNTYYAAQYPSNEWIGSNQINGLNTSIAGYNFGGNQMFDYIPNNNLGVKPNHDDFGSSGFGPNSGNGPNRSGWLNNAFVGGNHFGGHPDHREHMNTTDPPSDSNKFWNWFWIIILVLIGVYLYTKHPK